MTSFFLKPADVLLPFIERIYVWESGDHTFPLIVPGTGLDLIFHLEEPFAVQRQKTAHAHIICPRKCLQLDAAENTRFIAVRFRTGMFRHFCKIPYAVLNDQLVAAEDIWGDQARILIEQLSAMPAVADKIALIENFLWNCFLKCYNREAANWDNINHFVYQHFDTVSLKELARSSNMSYRSFERHFNNNFGIAAKFFQKLTRFERTMKHLYLNKADFSNALAFGYYDQSHFIKDCRAFSNLSPRDYFNRNKDHFYHKSIR